MTEPRWVTRKLVEYMHDCILELAGGARVSLCEAAENDAWFGVVFAAPGTDPDMCGVGKSVPNAREYQGPCRWGWIRGGTVQLGG